MKKTDEIYLKLSNYLSNKLPDKLKAPLINKVKIFPRHGLTLRMGSEESQLDKWWMHPVKILVTPNKKGYTVIQFRIQPARMTAKIEEYAAEHQDLVDKTVENVQNLTSQYFDILKDVQVKTNFKKRYNITLVWQIKVGDDFGDKSNKHFAELTDYLAELSQHVVRLGEGLKIAAADESQLEQDNEEENDFSDKKYTYLFQISTAYKMIGDINLNIDEPNYYCDEDNEEYIPKDIFNEKIFEAIKYFVEELKNNDSLQFEKFFLMAKDFILTLEDIDKISDKDKKKYIALIEDDDQVSIAAVTDELNKLEEFQWSDIIRTALDKFRFRLYGVYYDEYTDEQMIIYQCYADEGEFDTGYFSHDPDDYIFDKEYFDSYVSNEYGVDVYDLLLHPDKYFKI